MTRRLMLVLIVLFCTGGAGAQAPAPARPVSADFVPPGPVVPLDGPVMNAIDGLRSQSLASHIAFLSSRALEGRGLASPGLEAAAEYVAAQLAFAGVGPARTLPVTPNPAAPYFHPVAVRQISGASCEVRVESRRGLATTIRTFRGGVDAVCPELPPAVLSAPVVYAAYGIRESSPARDDYRDLDVKGTVVLLHAGLPPGPEWQHAELRERYAAEPARRRFAAKVQAAAAGGAAAIIAIEGPAYASTIASGGDAPASVFYTSYEPDDGAGMPVVRLSAAAGEAVLEAAGVGGSALSAQPRTLPGTSVSLTFGGQDRLVDTTFFGVIWLSVFLGAYWVSRSAGHLGWHPAWGLCFLLVPATLISIDRMTVDLTLTALTAGFAYYAREGPSWRLGTVLACAALTRETGVLLLAGYGLYLLSRRLWARAILFAAAGAPLLVWLGFLEKAMRGVHPDTGFPYRTGAPFGICLFMSPPYPGPEILAWILRALDYLVMTGVLLAAFLAVRHVLKRPRTPEGFVAWMFVLMLVPIVTVFNLYDPYTYPRLISPLLVLVALQELPARAWLGLLPLAFLSARAAVQLGTQVVGIWRGFVGG